MYKLIAVLLFALAMSKAEGQGIGLYFNSSVPNTDTYINMYRQQYEKNLQDYDNQINIFKHSYAASLEIIKIQLDMLIDTLTQTNERLNPLAALSKFSQECVKKYGSSIPTIAKVKTSVNSCVNTTNNQLSSLLSAPLSTRSYLASYYNNTFEERISNCTDKFDSAIYISNYTVCIVEAVDAANAFTISNQKTFDSQMTAARCTADANINKALDCSYAVESNTITLNAEANTLIKKCLSGQDECKKCSPGYSCPYISYKKKDEINRESSLMANPFYRQPDLTDCLLLKLY